MSETMLLQMWKTSPAAFLILAGMVSGLIAWFMWLVANSDKR